MKAEYFTIYKCQLCRDIVNAYDNGDDIDAINGVLVHKCSIYINDFGKLVEVGWYEKKS